MAGEHAADDRDLTIRDWHAHFYFDADEAEEAGAVARALHAALGVPMGRVHTRPVGPHPRGSCQMTIDRQRLIAALEWLTAHRGRFTIFLHPNTGDDLADHTAHMMWMGPSETLDTSQFVRR
ncbi:MAG: DOPA 4,5-dioxygenase family protein [Sphingomonas fennica]